MRTRTMDDHDDFEMHKFLGIFSLTLLICYKIYHWVNNRYIPPGPIGLPVVGYSPFLGKMPHITLRDLGRKYGDVFSFYIGPKLMVCVTDYDLAKEVLTHPMTLTRPPHSFDFMVGHGGFGGMNGEAWQEQRRFAVQTMRNLGLGKGLWETMTQEEANEYVKEMKKSSGQPVDFEKPLNMSQIKNNISLLFGRHLDPDADKKDIEIMRQFAKELMEHLSTLDINVVLPWLNKVAELLNWSGYQEFLYLLRKFEAIFRTEIDRRLLSKEELSKDDFIGCYLREMEKRKKEGHPHNFSLDNLQGNMLLLFVAGQDSTNASVSWLLLLMAKYPDVQKKICDEIDHAIGRDGVVYYDDRDKLPYTVATTFEMLRYISITLLFPSRYVMESFTCAGYVIPEGANVTVNSWAISHDPRYFEDPMDFKPERFLVEDGQKPIRVKGYAPFSFGKRNCPGDGIAMMTMYLFFVSIMQKFSIKTADGSPPDMSYTYKAATLPEPQKICFIER